ncbi:hypothetical protein QBC46DRAFT_403192 [Diplogelasinospora grovesii]|uniref:Uncharacterized protein n=1 Tax=Diplogelasinospora grovesii TaxID=303347 RepID=A0AAN6NGQ9_9PEZI|nr:hypothetical protein QBC46DRAFT_403192 [Diplogelasinospora grovesii]
MASARLNPEMVYRPLSPPSASYPFRADGNDDDGNDGGNPRKRCGFRVRLLSLLRGTILFLSVANIIIWIVQGGIGLNSLSILIFIELFLITAWNGFLLWPRKDNKASCLPRMTCHIGDYFCSCGGDGRDDGPDKGKKKITLPILWFVDFAFGLAIILFTCFGWKVWMSWYQWRKPDPSNRERIMLPAVVIDYIIGGLNLAVVIMSPFKLFRSALFEVAVLTDETEAGRYRIRLPSDDVEHRPATASTVSSAFAGKVGIAEA